MRTSGWVMMSIWITLSLVSLAILVRSLVIPLNATSAKLVATKRVLLLNSWIFLVAIGISVQAFVSGNYYLFFAGVILLTLVAPIAVQYLRLKRALSRS
jgi:hypothetical protein